MDTKRVITFTQELIRERSLSGEEQNVIARVVAEMKSVGFDQVWIDENGSAVGVINGAKPGQTLLLDGHVDTVQAHASDWTYDPFAATIHDGYLYGRGVCDMKGSVAAMIHAAASVDRANLAGRVAVSATVSEEVMEGITIRTVMDAVKPDAVIIGEATEFTINRGGRGRAEIVIETVGKSAHSSSPQAGLCAVHEMMRVIHAIEILPLPVDPAVGEAQLCLTDIVSVPYPGHSVVPNRCRVSYDRRLVPGETPESVLASLRDLPELQGVQYSLIVLDGIEKTSTGKTLQALKFFPAWAFAEDHPLVTAASAGLRKAGFETRLGAYRFCTNGAHSAGVAGVPTIGFGPGKETDAHTVNERMLVSELERAAEGYLAIIQSVLS
ncbi:MAG: YgeY family selenium metabolism-linked hydrolase [Chloroflexi bacterium]|nr:YgeY family selenium metabolism-linked hydrolase [Chloroflexota bacterium]